MTKRNIGVKAFDFEGTKIEQATGGTVRMKVKIQDGLEKLDKCKSLEGVIKIQKELNEKQIIN
jgi:uncharacterized protein YajQ (UPF0234 family)